jgi:predicted nucleic acid-binding protein
MKRVVDSSVGVKWVIPEQDSDKALLLLDDFQNGVIGLSAPDIFLIEAVHAITRAERQNRITPVQGAQAVTDLLNQQPQLNPYIPLLPRAYAISSQARIGVYDCVYVALAEREGCEFVTADDKLIRNLQSQFSFIVALASLP